MKMSDIGPAVLVLGLLLGAPNSSAVLAQTQTTPAAPAPAPVPFGYGYFPGYYNVNANTGNLYGSAQMVDAQGRLMLSTQQAKMDQEKVKQEKLTTRQKSLDQWQWERDHLPNTEDERRRMSAEELRRSRFDPPVTEINSGYSLNVLLKDLQRMPGGSASASPVILDPTLLKHINLTPADKEVSIGLFRDGGQLQWPYALRDSTYDTQRALVEKTSKKAVEQAKTGKIDFQTLNDLHKGVDAMEATLKDRISTTPSNRWVEGKRYITQLKSSVAALEDPNVGNYFGKWQAKGNTVPELVNYITSQGLHFAPASQGDETAYQALYRVMADYDNALAQRVMAAHAPPADGDKDKKSSGILGVFGFK